jgi:hypothetical protein
VNARKQNGFHELLFTSTLEIDLPTWVASARGATGLAARCMGTSHRNSTVAALAPAICATMKPGASFGRIPANVSVAARASVTAGFANDVEAVNQYAAVM